MTAGESIKFAVSGTIDVQFQVGPLPPGIFQGAPFQAILSYELTTPDSQADDPQRGLYSTFNIADNFLLIRAGTSEMRSIDPLTLWIGNDVDEPQELFEFPDDTFSVLDVPFTGNFEHSILSKMVLRWSDPSLSAFTSDALPTMLDSTHFFDAIALNLNPPQFVQPFIEISTFEIDPRVFQFTVRALVDSITVIPEPTTLCSSLVALFAALTGHVRPRRIGNKMV